MKEEEDEDDESLGFLLGAWEMDSPLRWWVWLLVEAIGGGGGERVGLWRGE